MRRLLLVLLLTGCLDDPEDPRPRPPPADPDGGRFNPDLIPPGGGGYGSGAGYGSGSGSPPQPDQGPDAGVDALIDGALDGGMDAERCASGDGFTPAPDSTPSGCEAERGGTTDASSP